MVIIFLLWAPVVQAGNSDAENAASNFSAFATLVSDNVWRGVSQSNEDIAVQAGFELESRGLYLGLWSSSVDFDGSSADDADLELDVSLGYRFTLEAGFDLDFGLVEYTFPSTKDDLDYLEAYAGLSWRWLGLNLAYSNDVFASGCNGLYVSLSSSHSLPSNFELNATVGQSSFAVDVFGKGEPSRYLDWSMGLSWSHGAMSLGLTYHGTDSDGETLFGRWAGDRVVLSLSASL